MAKKKSSHSTPDVSPNAKISDLEKNIEDAAGQFLTSNQGVRINDDHNSLKAGERGPTLLEDFLLREKSRISITSASRERVVHARGSGAHGYFELNQSMAKYSRAAFLHNVGSRTPVFVRFSTVAGSRGSTIWRGMSEVSQSSFTPKRETLILSGITCPSSSFKMRSSFPI